MISSKMKNKVKTILPKIQTALDNNDALELGKLIGYLFGLVSGNSMNKDC